MDKTETTVTTTQEQQVSNKSTEDQKKIISRLVLQRVLSSDVSSFLSDQSRSFVNDLFLSESPERDVSLDYRVPGQRDYYASIAALSLKWEKSVDELQDLEGNVWVTHTLKIVPQISSTFSPNFKSFMTRAECIAGLAELANDIKEMVPGPIRILMLDNAGRIARDDKRKYDAACAVLTATLFSGEEKKYRRGLRKGGMSRPVPRELFPQIQPGTYHFEINDGSHRRPVIREYLFVLPDDTFRSGRLSRVR